MRNKFNRLAMVSGLSTLIGTTVFAIPNSASAAPLKYASTSMTLNGQSIYISDHIIMNDPWSGKATSWLPIYYLDQALAKLGLTVSWDGSTGNWRIQTPSAVQNSSASPSTHATNRSNEATIQINGRIVSVVPRTTAPDPVTGSATTYLPIYYIEQALRQIDVDSKWNGRLWAMTSVTLHYVQGKLEFKKIHMVDDKNGWALSNEYVWHTTDGGKTWSNVTPKGYAFQRLSLTTGTTGESGVDFLDGSHAWLVETSGSGDGAPTGHTVVCYTNDGGSTWHQSSIQTPPMGDYVDFINENDGWLMANLGAAMGSEGVAVWHTTNGGQNWSLVAEGDTNHTAIPFGGDKTGISFANAKTGWITATEPTSKPCLYGTTDGGQTWKPQSIAFPSSLNSTQSILQPPMMFSDGQGILVDCISGGSSKNHLVLYTKSAISSSWHLSSNSALGTGSISSVQFINMSTGWALVHNMSANYNYAGYSLYKTTDGGQHWTNVGNVNDAQQLSNLNFANSSIGWIIRAGQGGTSTLMMTRDGGKNWGVVSPKEQGS